MRGCQLAFGAGVGVAILIGGVLIGVNLLGRQEPAEPISSKTRVRVWDIARVAAR